MLKLPKTGTVADLKEELGMLSGVKATHLAVIDVYNSRFHRIYSDRDPLSHIMDRVNILNQRIFFLFVYICNVDFATG